MKKFLITSFIVLLLVILSSVCFASSFLDLAGHQWAEQYINEYAKRGIIAGTGNNMFSPSKNVKREEFVKVIVTVFNYDTENVSCSFSDVDQNSWYYKYVSAATSANIINGVGDNKFGTGQYVTRQDICTILYRVLQDKNIKLKVVNNNPFSFTDKNEINSYAYTPMEVLYKANVINGISEKSIAPKNYATRAQMIKLVYLCENSNNDSTNDNSGNDDDGGGIAIAPTEIDLLTLNKTQLYLQEGEHSTLKVTVSPSNAKFDNLSWASSNTSVATVDKDGTVHALKTGTAKITVKSSNNKMATCNVTVKSSIIYPTNISLSENSVTLEEGMTKKISATILPNNVTDKSIIWSSDNIAIASVNSDGKIAAISAGETIINATTSNDIVTKCLVTVLPKVVAVDSISVSVKNITLKKGDTYKLTAAVLPDNATNKLLTWISSNPSIVTVDENGNINCIKEGTAKITTKSNNNKTASCTITVIANVIPVSNVTVAPPSTSLKVGQTKKLYVTVEPSNATEKNVIWSSSNSSIVTVDQNANITGVSAGTAQITATSVNGIKSSCTVTVTPSPVDVSAVSISSTSATLEVSQTKKLTATVSPSNATNKNITWSSSKPTIASVDQNGTVTALKTGTTTITAKSNNNKTASCTITVIANVIPVSNVTVAPPSTSLKVGQTKKLYVTVEPSNATEKNVIWSSSNSSIVTVDQNANITGVSAGTAQITATSVNGIKSSCTVTVTPSPVDVSAVSISSTSATLEVSQTKKLTATVSPSNATNKNITWSSSKPTIASVDQNGTVTALKTGTTTITAKSNNNKTASCTITVSAAVIDVTGVSLNFTSLNLVAGNTKTLSATITPSTATDKTITWSSSNTSVATVNNKGKLTAINSGNAIITATTSNGITATCNVQVTVNVSKITIQQDDTSAKIGDTTRLAVTVTPDNATDKTITWSSSDDSIVSVNSNGEINCLALGTAEITATSSNNKRDKITIKVIPDVDVIELKNKAPVRYVADVKIIDPFSPDDEISDTRDNGAAEEALERGFQDFDIDFNSNRISFIVPVKALIDPSKYNSTWDEKLLTSMIIRTNASNVTRNAEISTNNSQVTFVKISGQGQFMYKEPGKPYYWTSTDGRILVSGKIWGGNNDSISRVNFDPNSFGDNPTISTTYSFNESETDRFTAWCAFDWENDLMAVIEVELGVGRTVHVYNATKAKNGTLEELYTFSIPAKTSSMPSTSTQGHALYGGYLYRYRGNYADGIWIEIFDMFGNNVETRRFNPGYKVRRQEAQGIKIYDGKIYIGVIYRPQVTMTENDDGSFSKTGDMKYISNAIFTLEERD